MKPSNIAIWNIKGSGYDGIRQNQVSFLAYREDSKKIGLFDQQNKNNSSKCFLVLVIYLSLLRFIYLFFFQEAKNNGLKKRQLVKIL